MFTIYSFSNLLVLSQMEKNISKHISLHLFFKME